MAKDNEEYYVPEQSPWPIVGAIGLGFFAIGVVSMLQDKAYGHYVFLTGSLIIAYMMYGWFRDVVRESLAGLYSKQMNRSFRWGMIWFIFSEVMFFAALFGALFYARVLSVPDLAEGYNSSLLWPEFTANWPLLNNPNPKEYQGPIEAMGPWGLPAMNTLLLLTSGATITFAHWGLQLDKRSNLITGLALTVMLGAAFIVCQGFEYYHAYHELKLTLDSGIYGSLFFMLTGFHGAHVTVGTIMLFVILIRSIKGHFTHEEHFAFEAAAWYWHFVDVVWLILFVFVYWL